MMFDIYVMGINPERAGEIETIKKNVAKILKAEGEVLELLLAPTDGPVCIQENVSETQAIKIRQVLTDIGLLCSYQLRSTSRWGDLSLKPQEEKSADSFTCPACKTEHP